MTDNKEYKVTCEKLGLDWVVFFYSRTKGHGSPPAWYCGHSRAFAEQKDAEAYALALKKAHDL